MNGRALAARLHSRARAAVARRFGIDTRALAALRVSLGVLVVADLADRARNLVAFYTDAGVLPRAALRAHSPWLARLSIHTVSGEAWVQALLFSVAAAVAVALVVGYRTRLATVASVLLLASLHARNPVLLHAGDSLLRRLLLWGVFLPLGERWSVDARRTEDDPRPRVAGMASAAILLQVVIVYTENAAFKLRGDPWVTGDAMVYVFALEPRVTTLGEVLANYPAVLELLGYLWLVMVVSSVLLVVLTGRARSLFAGLFVLMHAGMALTMHLGLFPLVSIAALLPFFHGDVWDTAETRLGATVRAWRGRLRPPRHARMGGRWMEGHGGPLQGIPATVSRWKRRVSSVVVAVLLVAVLAWNGAALGYVSTPADLTLPADPEEHRWDMFAPSPSTADGWYVVPGRLESGRRVDAFYRSPVRWDRPPDDAYPTIRWLEYLFELQRGAYAHYRPYFADYLCRRWNATHRNDLVTVSIYYVREHTRLHGSDPTRRVKLLEYACDR